MRSWLLVLCCVFGLINAARADERILEFFSDAKVETDGDLLVTESLRVRSEGKEVRTGLRRDFSRLYLRPDGSRIAANLDVLSVRRDGRPEPFDLSRLRNGVRVTTGSPDTVFRPGEYQYVITYRISRQLTGRDGEDVLVWDVTGKDWTLPIDNVRARVVLPEDAPVRRAEVLAAGGRPAPGAVQEENPGRAVFVSNRSLAPGESMTVDVAWPAGVVRMPGPVQAWWYFAKDHAMQCVAVLGAAALALFYLWAWIAVGGPRRRARGERFDPPEGMSAQAARYVYCRGFDRWTFLAGLMDLLARRSMRAWTKPDGRYLERLPNQTGSDGRHEPMLNVILGRFFSSGRTLLRLDGFYRRCYDEAQMNVRQMLESSYAHVLFAERADLARQGVYIWLVTTVAVVGLAIIQVGTLRDWAAVGMVVPLPAVPVLFGVLGQWRAGATSRLSRVVMVGVALLFLAVGLWLLATHAGSPATFVSGLVPLVLLPLVCASFQFLRGYTRTGRAVRDEIDGFRRFLLSPGLAPAPATADEAMARYERYLPYALALNAERRWAAAHAPRLRGEAPAALADMQARYGAAHDVLDQPRAIMRGLDRWSARVMSGSRVADGGAPDDAAQGQR